MCGGKALKDLCVAGALPANNDRTYTPPRIPKRSPASDRWEEGKAG